MTASATTSTRSERISMSDVFLVIGNRLVSDFFFNFTLCRQVRMVPPLLQKWRGFCQRKSKSSNKNHIKRDTASCNTEKSSVSLHRPYTHEMILGFFAYHF